MFCKVPHWIVVLQLVNWELLAPRDAWTWNRIREMQMRHRGIKIEKERYWIISVQVPGKEGGIWEAEDKVKMVIWFLFCIFHSHGNWEIKIGWNLTWRGEGMKLSKVKVLEGKKWDLPCQKCDFVQWNEVVFSLILCKTTTSTSLRPPKGIYLVFKLTVSEQLPVGLISNRAVTVIHI